MQDVYMFSHVTLVPSYECARFMFMYNNVFIKGYSYSYPWCSHKTAVHLLSRLLCKHLLLKPQEDGELARCSAFVCGSSVELTRTSLHVCIY